LLKDLIGGHPEAAPPLEFLHQQLLVLLYKNMRESMAAPLIAVAKARHKASEMCIIVYEMAIDFLWTQEIEVEIYAITFLMIYFIVQSACSQCIGLICDLGSVRVQAPAEVPHRECVIVQSKK
jgi:hypothetical protein